MFEEKAQTDDSLKTLNEFFESTKKFHERMKSLAEDLEEKLLDDAKLPELTLQQMKKFLNPYRNLQQNPFKKPEPFLLTTALESIYTTLHDPEFKVIQRALTQCSLNYKNFNNIIDAIRNKTLPVEDKLYARICAHDSHFIEPTQYTMRYQLILSQTERNLLKNIHHAKNSAKATALVDKTKHLAQHVNQQVKLFESINAVVVLFEKKLLRTQTERKQFKAEDPKAVALDKKIQFLQKKIDYFYSGNIDEKGVTQLLEHLKDCYPNLLATSSQFKAIFSNPSKLAYAIEKVLTNLHLIEVSKYTDAARKANVACFSV